MEAFNPARIQQAAAPELAAACVVAMTEAMADAEPSAVYRRTEAAAAQPLLP